MVNKISAYYNVAKIQKRKKASVVKKKKISVICGKIN